MREPFIGIGLIVAMAASLVIAAESPTSQVFTGHFGRISCFAYLRSSGVFVTGGERDPRLLVYRADTLVRDRAFEGLSDGVKSVKAGSDGQTVLAIDRNGSLMAWKPIGKEAREWVGLRKEKLGEILWSDVIVHKKRPTVLRQCNKITGATVLGALQRLFRLDCIVPLAMKAIGSNIDGVQFFIRHRDAQRV